MHIRGGIGRDAVVVQPGFTGSKSVAGVYTSVSRLADDHAGAVIYALTGEQTIAVRVRGDDRLVSALDSLAARD